MMTAPELVFSPEELLRVAARSDTAPTKQQPSADSVHIGELVWLLVGNWWYRGIIESLEVGAAGACRVAFVKPEDDDEALRTHQMFRYLDELRIDPKGAPE